MEYVALIQHDNFVLLFFLLWRVCFKEDILRAFCLDKKRKVGYFLDTVQAMSINFNMNITFSELYPYASSMTLTLCQGQIVVGNVNLSYFFRIFPPSSDQA